MLLAGLASVDAWLDALPEWVGPLPNWGILILLAIVAVRTSPEWLNTWSTLRLARSNRNRDRIRELEAEVHRCHRDCDTKIDKLQAVIQGLREQRNAEQLAIMRAIVRMSGDPAVKQQLHLLESLEVQQTKIEPLKGAEDHGESEHEGT